MKFNKNLLSFCFFSALFALSPIATDSGYSEECTLEQNNVFSFHDRGPHEQNSYSSSSKSFKGYSGWQGPLRVNLDYSGGQWIGHDGGFTSLGLFSTVPGLDNLNCSPVPFFDLRGHMFNDGKMAANVGFGLRCMNGDCNALGINVFYDYRQGRWRDYHQIGVGLESLGTTWDYRINGYFPIGNKVGFDHKKKYYHHISGGYHATRLAYVSAMSGGDIEFGRMLKNKGDCGIYDFYGALDFYYYSSAFHSHQTGGAVVRFASNICRYYSVEAKAGYDHISNGIVEVRFSIEFPFGDLFCKSEKPRRGGAFAFQPIQRQRIIALDDVDCTWTWDWNDESLSTDGTTTTTVTTTTTTTVTTKVSGSSEWY